MKSVIGVLVVSLLLAGAGRLCWMLADAERRVAAAQEQLQTMQYGAVAESDADAALGRLSNVPAIGTGMVADVHMGRSTASYWLSQYDALKAQRDAGGALTDSNPELLLLGANATFRAAQVETVDRPTALQHLDQVVNGYRDVLRANPADLDAAYNYEFAVRQRNTLAAQRGAAAFSKIGIAELTPTIHGVPGAPPKGVSMSEFKVTIPRRSEERQQNQDAGKGNQKQRKG